MGYRVSLIIYGPIDWVIFNPHSVRYRGPFSPKLGGEVNFPASDLSPRVD